MTVFRSIVVIAIFQASLQLDNYNWTESVSDYSKNYEFMSVTELFLCAANSNVHHRLVKSLNAKGIYCNVNLIAAKMAPFGHNNRKISKTLSSINFEHHTIMIVDTGCAFASTLLKLASEMKMFNHHYQWLLIVDEHDDKVTTPNNMNIVELLSALSISISTQIVLFRTTLDAILLFDVWNPSYHHGGHLVIVDMGNFTHGNGLQIFDEFRMRGKVRRRMNMQQIQLRVMSVITQQLHHHETFQHYLYERHEPERDSLTRFNFALLDIIRGMFNLSFFLHHTKSWGYKREDGSFDGMIGALVKNETDVGGSSIFFRAERHEVVSYTSETWTQRSCFIFQQPDYSATIGATLFVPFSQAVWILLGIFALVFTFVLNLFEGLENAMDGKDDKKLINNKSSKLKANHFRHNCTHIKQYGIINQSHKSQRHWNVIKWRKNVQKSCMLVTKSLNNNNDKKKSRRRQRWWWRKIGSLRLSQNQRLCASLLNQLARFDGILIFVTAMSQQGITSIRSNLLSMKITIFILTMFAFLIFQFYSGSITSSILQAQPDSIKTLRDLIDSPLRLAVEDIVYNKDFFNRTTDPDVKRLHREKIVFYNKTTKSMQSNYYPPEYGMKLVKTGKYAFHTEDSTAYEIIRETFDEKLICKLSEIEIFPSQQQRMVHIVQKNSTFRELFTYGFRRLKEVGIMSRMRKIFHSEKLKCARNVHSEDFTVEITAIYPLLILLFCGITLSFLVLSAEVWISRRSHQH